LNFAFAPIFHRVARGEENDAREHKGGQNYGNDRKEKDHQGSSGGGVHWTL
jgi:hypothetical protein